MTDLTKGTFSLLKYSITLCLLDRIFEQRNFKVFLVCFRPYLIVPAYFGRKQNARNKYFTLIIPNCASPGNCPIALETL